MRLRLDASYVWKRFASVSGETMVETLISILISALALLLLATAIGSSVRIVMTNRERMDEYYSGEGGIEVAGLSTSGTVSVGVPLNNGGSSENVSVYSDSSTGITGITYYERSTS